MIEISVENSLSVDLEGVIVSRWETFKSVKRITYPELLTVIEEEVTGLLSLFGRHRTASSGNIGKPNCIDDVIFTFFNEGKGRVENLGIESSFSLDTYFQLGKIFGKEPMIVKVTELEVGNIQLHFERRYKVTLDDNIGLQWKEI